MMGKYRDKQPDIDILHSMLKDDYRVACEWDDNEICVHLVEEVEEDNVISILVKQVPEDVFVINADEIPIRRKQIFKNSQQEAKCADYVFISEAKKRIIYIEIKKIRESGKGGKGKKYHEKQLRGAACLIDYLRSIGQSFWNKKDFLVNYESRYVVLKVCDNPLRRSSRDKGWKKLAYTDASNYAELLRHKHVLYNEL